MYRFNLGDLSVECDTADELRAACVNGLAEAPIPRATRRRKKKRQLPKIDGIDLDSLPLIEGPVSWDAIKKIAKQTGFGGDLRQLRTAIVMKRKQAAG